MGLETRCIDVAERELMVSVVGLAARDPENSSDRGKIGMLMITCMIYVALVQVSVETCSSSKFFSRSR